MLIVVTWEYCFNFRTIDAGDRMIVEPCGGYNCISIINNIDLEKNDMDRIWFTKDGCVSELESLSLHVELTFSDHYKDIIWL
jgi:hypothetical protein